MADESGFIRVWDIVANRFRVEMVRFGSPPNAQSPDDKTPLHSLCISPDGETVFPCLPSNE